MVAIRPAMTYGAECQTTRIQNMDKMSVTEMRILRQMCSKTMKDTIRKERIWENGISSMDAKLKETHLKWFGQR